MLDSVFLGELIRELDLAGSRINKINQSERGELIFTLYGPAGQRRLLISANPSAPRIHYTQSPPENPREPPMFCMFLRKYLQGALITGAEVPGGDRLAEISLECSGDFGPPVCRRLTVELMGRYSNIILTDSDGRIMECLRRVDAQMNPERQVLPGLIYRRPGMGGRIPRDESAPDIIKSVVSAAPDDSEICKYLLSRFAWISPITAREAAFLAAGDAEARFSRLDDRRTLVRTLDMILNADAAPYTLYDLLRDGEGRLTRRAADFSYIPIKQYGEAREAVREESFSILLENFYTARETAEHLRQRKSAVRKAVQSARQKLSAKLAAQRRELDTARERDDYRRFGELITGAMYLIGPAAAEARLPDYSAQPDENGVFPTVGVRLDPSLSPQENAQRYFRLYRRAKSAQEYLCGIISGGELELEYLDSVLDEIDRASGDTDLAEIRAELADNGYASQRWNGRTKGAKRRLSPAAPFEYISSGGFRILVGRNNRQNEQLTLKTASRSDIWLHAAKIPGSHVLILCGGAEPGDDTIREAAALAVYHSSAKDSGRAAVDYTRARNVRRRPGGRTGMVFYTDYKTVSAFSDRELVERLSVVKK